MQSMIASQQQLIRRSVNSNNNNNYSDSNDHKNHNTNESPKSLSEYKDNELNESTNCQTGVQSLADIQSITSTEINDCNNSCDVRKSVDKTKKKRSSNSWLNILNPSYKTRHEEFKRLFYNSVPNNERLVVDYSCALQKEILVHGRLYLSLNYISFYANIFKWETSLVIKCRDITSLTKANTARVIPNAIQVVTTSGDKYVFTSFGARDKTYVMLFRIWQNALLDQPMSSAQLGQWVHYSYGEDLGLTSDDDEEYYSDQLVQTLSSENRLIGVDNSDSNSSDELHVEREVYEDCLDSRSTPSDCKCVTHEGKLIMNTTFPVSIDRMFELVFTDSKFIHSLHKSRRTYDLCVTQWDDSSEDKKRQLKYTVALNHALVKSARTIENQILLEDSSPGECYAIKSEARNEGVPYCDTFSTHSLWCLSKESEDMTRVKVHSKVIFKKNVWGLALMKPMIEKSSIQGITDFCTDLSKQLPNWLQMQHNLGLSSHMAISDLPIDLKLGNQLPIDSSDLNFGDPLDHIIANPSIHRPRHKLHPIWKRINSLSDSFLIKFILLLLLFTLLLNFLIMTRILRIESTVYSDSLPSDESQTVINQNNLKDLIQNSIELIKNIETNLKQLKSRLNDQTLVLN